MQWDGASLGAGSVLRPWRQHVHPDPHFSYHFPVRLLVGKRGAAYCLPSGVLTSQGGTLALHQTRRHLRAPAPTGSRCAVFMAVSVFTFYLTFHGCDYVLWSMCISEMLWVGVQAGNSSKRQLLRDGWPSSSDLGWVWPFPNHPESGLPGNPGVGSSTALDRGPDGHLKPIEFTPWSHGVSLMGNVTGFFIFVNDLVHLLRFVFCLLKISC